MSITTTQIQPELPYPTPPLTTSREILVRAADHLWRVQDRTGRVLGHLRLIADPLGLRYRAERLQLSSGAFRTLGEFWRPDDAVDVLRYS